MNGSWDAEEKKKKKQQQWVIGHAFQHYLGA